MQEVGREKRTGWPGDRSGGGKERIRVMLVPRGGKPVELEQTKVQYELERGC